VISPKQPAPRVVVVEDLASVTMVLVAALGANGYEVVGQARGGAEAIRLATELRPDLVLMDVNLEGTMDGIEAAASIRGTVGTPVVFVTAYTDEETLDRARAAEPYGYLVKPLEPRMLRPTLEMALHKHAMDVERAQLTRRLEAALEEVEQLRGLIPVCAWCRRVRDDEGYWDTLEAYLSRRLSTAYTHGICESCAAKMQEQMPDEGA